VVPPPRVPSTSEPEDFLAQLKEMVQQAETLLGEKAIGGRRVKGFRLGAAPNVLDLWVDAATGAPVRIEQHLDLFGHKTDLVMTDFQVDAPLDDALFRTEPPDGYELYEHPSHLDD